MTNYEIICSGVDEAARLISTSIVRGCPPHRGRECPLDSSCMKCWRNWLLRQNY